MLSAVQTRGILTVELLVWQGRVPDYNDPVVIKKGATIEDFCTRIHKTFVKQFKHALVWGSSVKHRPQKVGLTHVLEDEDVVQLVKKV